MNDSQPQDHRLLVRRFPAETASEQNLPEGFYPLRLLLQPGGLCLELAQPDVLLGRHSSADVRLSLPDVSRRHCRFVFSDGHWEVIDLNSLNGIHVNGERLNCIVLAQGDRLRIGSLTFVVDLGKDQPSHIVLQRIADVLPGPQPSQEYRQAS